MSGIDKFIEIESRLVTVRPEEHRRAWGVTAKCV